MRRAAEEVVLLGHPPLAEVLHRDNRAVRLEESMTTMKTSTTTITPLPVAVVVAAAVLRPREAEDVAVHHPAVARDAW